MARLYLSLLPQILSQLSLKPRGKIPADWLTWGVRLSMEHPECPISSQAGMLPGTRPLSFACQAPGHWTWAGWGMPGQVARVFLDLNLECGSAIPRWAAPRLHKHCSSKSHTSRDICLMNPAVFTWKDQQMKNICCTLEREIHYFKHFKIHRLARSLRLFSSFTK